MTVYSSSNFIPPPDNLHSLCVLYIFSSHSRCSFFLCLENQYGSKLWISLCPSQVIQSTWLWATSGVIFRRCLPQLWNVTLQCLSATTRGRWVVLVTKVKQTRGVWSAARSEQAVLLPLCLRRWRSCWWRWIWIRRASSWAPAGWEHVSNSGNMSPADATCHRSPSFFACRCSWSEACCVTWSSRGSSRSPAGWSIYRPPAWDTWPVRTTANSRLVSRFTHAVLQ